MTIKFKVEDGTAYADSTSYASVQNYKDYCDKMGIDYSTDQSAQIEVYLNNATAFLDQRYTFMGFKRFVWTQALEWPRFLSHVLGRPYEFLAMRMIQANEIPKEIIEACCYLATVYKQEGALDYFNKGEKSVSIGPVSISYGKNKGYIEYPVVNALLRYLVTSGNVTAERVR